MVGSGPFGLSIEAYRELTATTSSLQCQRAYQPPRYGWVPGTKGVWVLDPPTEDQLERLSHFTPTNDQEVANEHLRDVGAVFYADYVCIFNLFPSCGISCFTVGKSKIILPGS